MDENWLLVKGPKSFEKRKVTRFFREEDCIEFINQIEKSYDNDHTQRDMLIAILVLLYRTGARISEIVYIPDSRNQSLYKYGLFFDDFIIQDDYIIVKIKTAKKHTKKYIGIQRYIWIKNNDPLLKYILKWKDKCSKGQPLFPIHRATVWERLKGIAMELGFEEDKFWLHYIRASSLSLDVARGATASQLKAKAGWSNIIYADYYIAENFDATKSMADKHIEQTKLQIQESYDRALEEADREITLDKLQKKIDEEEKL